MREIKFRVWDGAYMNDVGKTNYVVQTGFIDRDANHEKNIWLQYTGLEDMNGTEIYEGDILLISDRESGPQEVFYDSGVFGTREFALYELCGVTQRSCWVVGNIYANPELINQ